jgi:CRP/FNR family cyclic AMP-dependent transcriptional regulator
MASTKANVRSPFDASKYLETAGVRRRIVSYRKGQVIFAQGDKSRSVFYLREGRVKITVSSSVGKERVIALLGEHEFFGEGCIAGQPLRVARATAISPTSVLEIQKAEMVRVIHEEHEFSDLFVAHMLSRNVRVEEDLADQLFNFSEKRLARALLLVARYGKDEAPEKIVAKVSQETLGEMIGTTRSRVSFFMNKFRKLDLSSTMAGCTSTVRFSASHFKIDSSLSTGATSGDRDRADHVRRTEEVPRSADLARHAD